MVGLYYIAAVYILREGCLLWYWSLSLQAVGGCFRENMYHQDVACAGRSALRHYDTWLRRSLMMRFSLHDAGYGYQCAVLHRRMCGWQAVDIKFRKSPFSPTRMSDRLVDVTSVSYAELASMFSQRLHLGSSRSRWRWYTSGCGSICRPPVDVMAVISISIGVVVMYKRNRAV